MKTTGYKESLEQYKDLVDKKGFADYLGDAFSKVGSGPAVGEAQRMSNAMLSGMGAGISGAAAEERRQKLSPMLEQAGRITAKAAELEAQMQQAQSYQLAINEFGQKYTPLVAEFAAAVNSNDPRATMMFKDLVNKAQMIPGFENLEGDSWNPSGGYGLALNTETGEYRKITADEIVSAVAPAAQTIYGDQWFEKFMPLNAGFAKDAAYAFNIKRQEDALGLEGKRADVNLKQAHAGVYEQQANKIQNEIANPPMSDIDKFNYQETRKSNETFLKNLTEDVEKKDPDTKIKVLDKLENIIGSGTAGIGNTPLARMQRWTKENFGKDADIQEAKMLQKYFFPDIKGVAGNPNQKEWSDLVTRIISGEQNVDAALEMIKFEKEQANALKNKYNNYRKAIIDSGNRLPYYHPEITSRVEQTVSNPATSQTGSGNQNLPSDEELGIKFY